MKNNQEKFERIASEYNVSLFPIFMSVNAFYFEFQKNLGKRVIFAEIFKNHTEEYYAKLSMWQSAHEALVRKINDDKKELQRILDRTVELGQKIMKFGDTIPDKFSKLHNLELWKIYDNFCKINTEVFGYGLMLPLLDFQSSSYLSGKVNQILKKRVPKREISEYFSVLTTPAKETYSKKQDLALYRILAKIEKEPRLYKLLKNRTACEIIREIQAEYTTVLRDLFKHKKKYEWVYYGLEGPASDLKFYAECLQGWAKRQSKAREEIAKSRDFFNKLKKQQANIARKLGFDKDEQKIISLAREAVYIKPWRKDAQSYAYFKMEKILKEISKRFSVEISEVRMMLPHEIKKGLKDNFVDKKILKERLRYSLYTIINGMPILMTGKKAKKYFRDNFQIEEGGEKQVSELKGTVACPGKIRGRVTIVNMQDDMKKMKSGNVLVSFATNPGLMPAIRKAGGIITDEGGLTCHAAIVSRELRIPCVVGTKIATKVLKNGDRVEVDANIGRINIIKRAKK